MTHTDDTAGISNLPTTVPDVVLRPLSRHRIMDTLERLGYAYFVDRNAEISARWDHGNFFFSIVGHKEGILCGYWDGYLPAERRSETLEACNRWNREHYMPKAEVTVDGDGDQHILVEHSVDYEFGVTDEQINQHITGAVGLGNVFLRSITEQFPECAGGY